MTQMFMLDEEPFYLEVLFKEFEQVCFIARYYELYLICSEEYMHFYFNFDFYPYDRKKLPTNLSSFDIEKEDCKLMHKFCIYMRQNFVNELVYPEGMPRSKAGNKMREY